MKTINELEQEAISKAIMQLSCVAKEMTLHMQTLSRNLIEVSEQMRQLQAVSMCISSNEVSGDGSGESLPEVSQEERDSDGWIEWKGGKCPVDYSTIVDVKTKIGVVFERYVAHIFLWKHIGSEGDIVAYKIVKGE